MKCSPQPVEHRIAILSPTLAGGGAERGALHIAAGLIERGHDVDLVLQRLVCHYPREVPDKVRLFCLSDPGNAGALPKFKGVTAVPQLLVSEPASWQVRYPRVALISSLRLEQLPLLLSTRSPRWAAGIATYVDRERPTALLAINVFAAAATTMAASFMQRSPRIVATLNDVLRSRRLRHRARISYPHVDAAVGVSRGIAGELAGLSGMLPKRIHTIYNPVISTDFKQKALEPAGHPWLDRPINPVILAIGRMKKVKDFSTLLGAFARLRTWRPARLILLGEGPLKKYLLSLAKNLGIAEHVDFPGFVDNPHAFLTIANLFVLSSRYESFSRVLIEAMACGCPVVSTDCPYGPREILEGGKLGALVPVGNVEALAAAMSCTLDKPPRSDALRNRASFFSVRRAVDQYEKLLVTNESH